MTTAERMAHGVDAELALESVSSRLYPSWHRPYKHPKCKTCRNLAKCCGCSCPPEECKVCREVKRRRYDGAREQTGRKQVNEHTGDTE